jgi:HD-GYP domain-containing protein (c-di-GMP phosphodiesterase class II)
MKPLLLAPFGTLDGVPIDRRENDVELRRVVTVPAAASLDPNRPTVVLLDPTLLRALGGDGRRVEEVAAIAAVLGHGDPGDAEPPSDFPTAVLCGFIPGGALPGLVRAQLTAALRHAESLVAVRASRQSEDRGNRDLAELARVGVALSTERNLFALLQRILTEARRLSSSDAGSIYLGERPRNEQSGSLRFMLSQNDSIPNIPLGDFSLPVDGSSVAGHVAKTGEPLAIDDAYALPDGVPYRHNRFFDERFGYRSKSMLVLPLASQPGQVIGVLQLVNAKRTPGIPLTGADLVEREVVPFSPHDIELASALASQAAVALENSYLYQDIEQLFEGFVTAAVTAIEARDPTTFGHSGRVASMSVALAEVVTRCDTGVYREQRFGYEQLRELRYAGLLHDFGKVGVREEVLVKAKKLYPTHLEAIRHRFARIKQAAELEFERRRADHLLHHGRAGYDDLVIELRRQLRHRHQQLDDFLRCVLEANEPSLLYDNEIPDLRALTAHVYLGDDGTLQPLLSDEEVQLLTIPKGTLDPRERKEIESHVSHTYRFLQQIPWTPELKRVPEIALGHHEKLNGQGYPRGVCADQIPVQSRIMTIADIYDALTASDRPYKRAVPTEHALDILHREADQGLLDRELLRLFVEAKVFEKARAAANEGE